MASFKHVPEASDPSFEFQVKVCGTNVEIVHSFALCYKAGQCKAELEEELVEKLDAYEVRLFLKSRAPVVLADADTIEQHCNNTNIGDILGLEFHRIGSCCNIRFEAETVPDDVGVTVR